MIGNKLYGLIRQRSTVSVQMDTLGAGYMMERHDNHIKSKELSSIVVDQSWSRDV